MDLLTPQTDNVHCITCKTCTLGPLWIKMGLWPWFILMSSCADWYSWQSPDSVFWLIFWLDVEVCPKEQDFRLLSILWCICSPLDYGITVTCRSNIMNFSKLDWFWCVPIECSKLVVSVCNIKLIIKLNKVSI